MKTAAAPAANLKLSAKFLTVNGTRAGVTFTGAPWAEGVNPALIKIRSKKGYFAAEIRAGLAIENNSDMTTDYFEGDSIRLLPGHPLYTCAAAICAAQEAARLAKFKDQQAGL